MVVYAVAVVYHVNTVVVVVVVSVPVVLVVFKINCLFVADAVVGVAAAAVVVVVFVVVVDDDAVVGDALRCRSCSQMAAGMMLASS